MKQELLHNNLVDVVYQDEEILTEDQQEELTDKIIPSTQILDRINTQVTIDLFRKFSLPKFYAFKNSSSETQSTQLHYLNTSFLNKGPNWRLI